MINYPLTREGTTACLHLQKISVIHDNPPTVHIFSNSFLSSDAFSLFPRDTRFLKYDVDFDLWFSREVTWSRAFHTRAIGIIQDFRNGIHDKFPICCIIHYCLDRLLGRLPATRREIALKTKDGMTYVPCFFHYPRGRAK